MCCETREAVNWMWFLSYQVLVKSVGGNKAKYVKNVNFIFSPPTEEMVYPAYWFNQASKSATAEKSNKASPKASNCSIDNPRTCSIKDGSISPIR